MTNAERIVMALRAEPGLTDGELRERTGINPQQQVNQLCRRLEQQGRLRRLERPDGRIGNYLAEEATSRLVRSASSAVSSSRPSDLPAPMPAIPVGAVPTCSVANALLVIPCSGRKIQGGSSTRGPSVLDLLAPPLRGRLAKARDDVAAKASLDESRLLPAWRRYDGTMYREAHGSFAAAAENRIPVVIVSGCYGLLLAEECIGWYERRFSIRDWPNGLLGECLIAVTQAYRAQKVVAFCARTTDYAKLVRRTPWSEQGINAWLASPDMMGQGGAQSLVPQACGQAFAAYLDGELISPWSSAAGVPVLLEQVRHD